MESNTPHQQGYAYAIAGMIAAFLVGLLIGGGMMYTYLSEASPPSQNRNESAPGNTTSTPDTTEKNTATSTDRTDRQDGVVRRWNTIRATLDKTEPREGCYPRHAIDLYAVYDTREELIFDNLEVCDPGGRVVSGTMSESQLFSSEELVIDEEQVGEKVTYQFGDAGHLATTSIYFSYINPDNHTKVINGRSQGNNTFLRISRAQSTSTVEVSSRPDAWSTTGNCSEHDIRILVNDQPVWTASNRTKKALCEEQTFDDRTRITYRRPFQHVEPKNARLTRFSFMWDLVTFELDLTDPVRTFQVSGRGK